MYTFIFYHSYRLALRLKEWNDTPILFSTMSLGTCVVFHLGAILFLVEATWAKRGSFDAIFQFMEVGRYIVAVAVVGGIYLYYARNGRGEKIYKRISENPNRNLVYNINPMLAVSAAYVLSFLAGMVAAMYRNGDGIFKP